LLPIPSQNTKGLKMPRLSSDSDFTETIDGVGTFTFGRRKMRDEMRIAAEFSRLSEGVGTPSDFLMNFGGRISELKVLTVRAPEGWDIDEMDPLDLDTYDKLRRVHEALRAREESFRQPKKQLESATNSGQGAGAQGGVLVSPQVQPTADGSTIS
jgi:hypothetical protein